MAAKKSDDLNKNYPVLGFRVSRNEREAMIAKFEELIELLRDQPQYQRVNLKKNAVFLAALEIGIEHIRKKMSLG
jgi:hypothetical protein